MTPPDGYGYNVTWRSRRGTVVQSDGDDYRRPQDRDEAVARVEKLIENERGGTVLSVELRKTPSAKEEDLQRRDNILNILTRVKNDKRH